MKTNKPKTLQEAIQYFTDPENCIETVAALRWKNGPECPACGHKEHYYLAKQRRWKCKECWKQFSVKVGTIFEDSAIPLDKWLVALWMLVNCKNGISSYELAKDLGITQKSAWFVLQRLRVALKENSFASKTKIGGPDTEVEVDETWIGGKSINMHKARRLRYQQGGGHHGKTVVMGILDREQRTIRAKVVPNVKRSTLQAEVLSNVKYGTKVYTDSAPAYDLLHSRYIHDVVNHAEKYVEGRVSTNGLENFWSLFKRNLASTYVSVEPFHLELYVDEQVFRYNNRGGKKKENRVTDLDRFELALSQISNKRLTFAEITGKAGQQATD
jgi:transposase-like protein